MRTGKIRWICVMLAAVLFFSSANGICHAGSLVMGNISGDTSSDGAAITVVLFATICVVMVLLGLKADYQNIFGNVTPDERKELEARFAERMDAVLQEPEYRPVLRSEAKESEAQCANASLGFRLEF